MKIFKLFPMLFLMSVVFSNCSPAKQKLEKQFSLYTGKHDCRNHRSCTFSMRDLTWFEWDTMRLYQNETGSFCDFSKGGKVVYSYLKEFSFDGPQGIEFGFGDESLDSVYTSQNCNFRLSVETKENFPKSEVYFLLP